MTLESFATYVFRFLLLVLPNLIILIACYKYFKKESNIASKLMLLGYIILFPVIIFNSYFIYYFFSVDRMFLYDQIAMISSYISSLGVILFAIGFYILIRNISPKKEQSDIDNLGKN